MDGLYSTGQQSETVARKVAEFILSQLPQQGLLRGLSWRIGIEPLFITTQEYQFLLKLGHVLLKFYRAANLLYNWSVSGKAPAWIADWLDRGKPQRLIEIQRSKVFQNELPRVIRPDILPTADGFAITELDAVPGGIGLTAWLNLSYSRASEQFHRTQPWQIVGAPADMITGFKAIFGSRSRSWIMISEECDTYRPEMEWLVTQMGPTFSVTQPSDNPLSPGDAVYRFFELFDLENIPQAWQVIEAATQRKIYLTPPPKPALEEKMLLALLWNRNLRDFWRTQLSEKSWQTLTKLIPQTWLIDPSPLPPWGEFAGLGITDWYQLTEFSQKDRHLVLKVSGFSPLAWGARGVFIGHDLSREEWANAVKTAIASAHSNPFVLQRFVKPKRLSVTWYDPKTNQIHQMEGRCRLSPYYFVSGEWNNPTVRLGGILATICPIDKKIIHGMTDAVLVPVAISPNQNS